MSGLPVEQKNYKDPTEKKSKYEKSLMDKMKQRRLEQQSQPKVNPLNNQNPDPNKPEDY